MPERSLEQLLDTVRELFGDTGGACYEFTLGRIAGRWRFHVANSWHKWMDKGYPINFGADTPTAAVAAFLRYVQANKINVRSLTEGPS